MNELTLKAYAKINLSLAIAGKRPDGYHNLSTIMQTISLSDTVTIKKSDKITCTTDDESIPSGDGNIAVKVAKAFFELAGINGGVSIFIQKNIPSGAGMGGGSADAAAVLTGLNELYSAEISADNLSGIASKIGADVPFALVGGTALVEGIGDKISQIKPFMDCYILIVKPDVSISTVQAYSNYDKCKSSEINNMDELISCINSGDLKGFSAKVFNDFERTTDVPTIDKIKNQMISSGALASCMTGSGSAVFGIYTDESVARTASEKFLEDGLQSFVCRSVEKFNK